MSATPPDGEASPEGSDGSTPVDPAPPEAAEPIEPAAAGDPASTESDGSAASEAPPASDLAQGARLELGFSLGPLIGLLVLWAFAFGGGVLDMVDRWMAPKTYYAHGPIVPVVAVWLLWRDRAALARVPRQPSWGGLWLLVPALLMTAVGHLEDVKVIQNLALVVSLYGLVWSLFGRGVLLRAWVPALFLFFMVPLPGFVIDRLTFGLKMLAANLSVFSIHTAGIPAILDGGTIHLAETDVLVDDVCSGLKTMVALIGFSVVFAHLQATRLKAALILVLAVPVSIVANVVRILVLCWFAAVGNKAAFEGPLHEATGLLVYVLALVLFLIVQALPLPGEAKQEEAEPTALGPAPAPTPPERGHWAALYGVAGVGALLLAASLLTASSGAVDATQVTARIPATIGPWDSTRVLLTEEIYQVLGTRDAMFRRYTRAATTTTVDLYVTYAAGDIFRVAHPPERCFAGGGFTEQARRVVEIQVGGRTLSVNRIVFRRDVEQVLVYYWYRLNGKDVAQYTQYRFGSLLRRLQRYDSSGSMIRLSTVIDRQGESAAAARLDRFVAEALPAALEPIGD